MTFRTPGLAAALTALLFTACARDGGDAPARATDAAPAATPAAAAPVAATPLPAAGALSVDDAWIRLLPGGLPAAGYLVLHNDGDVARKLVSVDSDAFGMVMLHQSMRSSGMSHMRQVEAIDIPAHGSAALAPGGYHLMLMQPGRALEIGQAVTLVLHFADGASRPVAFEVRPANADGG